MTDEIVTEIRGRLGIITLNRPKALNALNTPMCEAITKAMVEWEKDNKIGAILIKGEGDRAFCAGGDVVMLAESGKLGDNRAENFWRVEYALNELISRYKKPYIALIDGIVMGGGVGLSVHGKYRIAGEKTLFAMPETGIGYFPDVGGTYFLPRLGVAIGNFMGLTGARVDGALALKIGVANYFISSENHPLLIEELISSPLKSSSDVETAIEKFAIIPTVQNLPPEISAFDNANVTEIIKALEAANTEWAAQQLKILRSKSPIAVVFTFEAMKIGANLNFRDAMDKELNWSMVFVKGHDFIEGIRAQLIDKDRNPKWADENIEAVSASVTQNLLNNNQYALEFLK